MKKEKNASLGLKLQLYRALLASLITMISVLAATFAWYIYNTSVHTTSIHMAAGTSTRIEISKTYDGSYTSSVDLASFCGTLTPVSTDKIENGFQKVYEYTEGGEGEPSLLANVFGTVENTDYFKTTFYLRSSAGSEDIYISGIDYDHNTSSELLATAVRVGLVVHEAGKDQPAAAEFIFSLSDASNPKAEYNTFNGKEGCVLDSTKTDGSVVKLIPYDEDNYASYDTTTGLVTLSSDSLKITELESGGKNEPGVPVQVDVYIWLEGCDKDCTSSLGGLALKNVSVSFAGVKKQE